MRPLHDARLVPAALVAYMVAGTVMGRVVGTHWWIAVGVGAAGVTVATSWRSARVRWLGAGWLAVVVAVVTSWMCSIVVVSQFAGGICEAIASGGEVVAEGVVVSDPTSIAPGAFSLAEPRWMAAVELDSIAVGGADSIRVTSSVRIAGVDLEPLEAGDRVTVSGTLSEVGPGRAAAVMWDTTVVSSTEPTGAGRAVRALRDGLRRATAGLAPEIGALTVGMTIGDTRGMSAEQKRDMRGAGLTHLTAVSGAQFAMLALAVGAGARALRWRRWIRAVLTAATMLAFAALVGPEPSVVRAAAMGAVVAFAVWWGRSSQALPSLCAAVIVLLLLDPYLALSYGFALSVAATAGIALWSPSLAAYLARALPPSLSRVLSIPIAAQVMCTPILVLFSGGVGPYAVIANVLAVPFATLVTALGLAAMLATAVWPPAGTAVASLAGLAARPVAWAARTVAHAPGSWIPWPTGVGGAAIAAVVSLAMVCATSTHRREGWARLTGFVAVATVLLAWPTIRASSEQAGPRAPEDWAFAVCDVGQGDMLLLRAGPHSAVVVDVGPPTGVATGCLERHGVSDVPLLVLTHPHVDHDGGLSQVLDDVDVAQAWLSDPGFIAPEAEVLRRAGVPFNVPEPGRSVTVGTVRLTVWHSTATASPTTITDSHLNDSSLVLWGDAQGVSFLAMGDLEVEGQGGLGRVAHLLEGFDVLKVAHHGSSVQDLSLLRRVNPAVAVISVGIDNPYGHPASGTIAALVANGAAVFRTDQCGDINVARRSELVVTSLCPLPVAGLTHAPAQSLVDRRNLGRRPPTAARPRGRPRVPSGGPRGRGDCESGQGRRWFRVDDCRFRAVICARRTPCRHQPVALRGAGRCHRRRR